MSGACSGGAGAKAPCAAAHFPLPRSQRSRPAAPARGLGRRALPPPAAPAACAQGAPPCSTAAAPRPAPPRRLPPHGQRAPSARGGAQPPSAAADGARGGGVASGGGAPPAPAGARFQVLPQRRVPRASPAAAHLLPAQPAGGPGTRRVARARREPGGSTPRPRSRAPPRRPAAAPGPPVSFHGHGPALRPPHP